MPDAHLKELNDPTILTSRVWFEKEWNHFEDGQQRHRGHVRRLLGVAGLAEADWAVRLKLPIKYRLGGDLPDIGGFGDVKIATGGGRSAEQDLAYRRRRGFSHADWSSRAQRQCMAHSGVPRHRVGYRPWLTFSPSFEYNQSL